MMIVLLWHVPTAPFTRAVFLAQADWRAVARVCALLQNAGGKREGDWDCPACGIDNYASRVACFKCQAAKPQ